MKQVFLVTVCLLFVNNIFSQSYNDEKINLTNFLKRMYKNAPFEGVRVVDDYETAYLISVLSLDTSKYLNASVINRIASVKAMSQASRYFNGSKMTSEIIITKSEKSDSTSQYEIIENIKENSVGYVKALEQLTNFIDKKGWQVFIFYKKLDNINAHIEKGKKTKKNKKDKN
ncbi:hypothetical protein [Butyricimonas paravirosa]